MVPCGLPRIAHMVAYLARLGARHRPLHRDDTSKVPNTLRS
jgi:hypothetical protein